MAKKIPEGVTPDLYKEYKRLADRADKRLLRLERLAVTESDTYGNVLAYAYKVAQKQTKYWSGDLEKPRYARDTPTSDKELKKKIKDIQKFLEMPTSTKTGIIKVYKDKADALNKKFETNFTWEDWARFGIRGYWDRQDGKFTYNELIKVAKIQKTEGNIVKAYNEVKEKKNKYKITGPEVEAPTGTFGHVAKDFMKEFLSKSDRSLIDQTVNTLFEHDEGLVLKQAKKYMKESGLDYNTMFK